MDRYEISAPRLAKKMADMQKEIESLRSDIDHLLTVCELRRLETEELKSDYENVCQDIELQNKQMGEWYAAKRLAEDERDEWKRRAKIMWDEYEPGEGEWAAFCQLHPEAAEWFEEE